MSTLYRYIALLVPLTFICYVSQSDEHDKVVSEESQSTAIAPTETNWNKIMGLIYAPAFSNLKKQIGSKANENEVDFVSIQRDALVIAEFTARLHDWPEIHKFESEEAKNAYLETHELLKTEQVQQHAASIYNAAKEKQLEPAKESFAAMTNSCNVCHRQKQSRWAPVVLEH